MSTYLEGVFSNLSWFLDLLPEAEVVPEADKEAVQSLEKIEKVLEKVKAMDLLNTVKFNHLMNAKGSDQTDLGAIDNNMLSKPKLLLQTLLYQVSCLELGLNDIKLAVQAKKRWSTIPEAIKKALVSHLPPIVDKIEHLMTLVQTVQQLQKLPEPEKKSGVDDARDMSQEPSTLGLEGMFNDTAAMANIRRSYKDLESTELKVCLLSFSIFPENSAIKKRPLIYWWIGEGFITSTKDKRADEIGEEIFEKLMRKDLIQPDSGEPNCELLVKSCTMHPWIRRMLISLAREANLFHFDSRWPMMPSNSMSACRRACLVSGNVVPKGDGLDALLTVFNVNDQYLNLEQKWLEKLKKVEVLQLGRWQNSATYHIEIEVEQQRFVGSSAEGILNGLGAQKHLKYLSLRGISRIIRLPDSILHLFSLEILDLRACHDLERLPSDISSLKKLTHLDVSECFLLEGMPNGIQKLASLQVLKGFQIGSLEKTKTPCRLGELAKLKNLRRLSIHIGNEAAVQPGEFEKLKESSSLRRLKISWGNKNLKENISNESVKFLFPPNLEKLDLQSYPQAHAPEGLKPCKLNKLKKLYIMGGELASLDHGECTDHWRVEIVRLHFLKGLKLTASLKQLFPRLQYLAVS